jgi:hypothetical protein
MVPRRICCILDALSGITEKRLLYSHFDTEEVARSFFTPFGKESVTVI